MGVSVKDKISAAKRRSSPANRVAAKLGASKKLLEDEAIAKARALLKGEKGDKGDPGPQGPKGDKGDKGNDGHTPVVGVDFIIHHGKDGADGKHGRDGDTGLTDDTVLQDAVFTYTGDLVTRIDYADGQSKVLTYNVDDTINTITWDRVSHIVTKTFAYDGFGNVTSVDVSGAIDIDDTVDVSGLVPYNGAIADVNLGVHNLALTGAINCAEIYNSLSSLKIMPDAQGNVDLFGDTDVANGVDGKIFSVNRRAAEGDTTISIFGNDDQWAHICANWDMSIYSTVANGVIELGSIPTNIVRLIGTVNAIGEPVGTNNLPLRHYGYITADSAQRYVNWLLDDDDDCFHLTRSDTNILGFKVDLPLSVTSIAEHNDNAAALLAGLAIGDVYRTGDLLKIVH